MAYRPGVLSCVLGRFVKRSLRITNVTELLNCTRQELTTKTEGDGQDAKAHGLAASREGLIHHVNWASSHDHPIFLLVGFVSAVLPRSMRGCCRIDSLATLGRRWMMLYECFHSTAALYTILHRTEPNAYTLRSLYAMIPNYAPDFQ